MLTAFFSLPNEKNTEKKESTDFLTERNENRERKKNLIHKIFISFVRKVDGGWRKRNEVEEKKEKQCELTSDVVMT